MAWIRFVSDEQATGRLAKACRAAIEGGGRGSGLVRIVRAMSTGFAVPNTSLGFSSAITSGAQDLTRPMQELESHPDHGA